MKMKRFLATATALSLLVGTTCFAADDATIGSIGDAAEGTAVEVSGSVEVPTISITVPTTADIVINPYQMSVTPDGAEASTNAIICPEYTITNESNVAVAVNVVSLGANLENANGAVMATSVLKGTETTKSVFCYLDVHEKGKTPTAYSKATNQLLVGTTAKPASKEAIATLAAGNETPATCDFSFAGSVIANPKVTDSVKAWSGSDSISIALKYSFTPQVITTTTNSGPAGSGT